MRSTADKCIMSFVSDSKSHWDLGIYTAKPDWWKDAEHNIHQHLSTFGSRVQDKLKVSSEKMFMPQYHGEVQRRVGREQPPIRGLRSGHKNVRSGRWT